MDRVSSYGLLELRDVKTRLTREAQQEQVSRIAHVRRLN